MVVDTRGTMPEVDLWFSHVCTHTHTRTCTHTHTHMCTHTHIHIHAHTYTHVHMYTHECTHIYTLTTGMKSTHDAEIYAC